MDCVVWGGGRKKYVIMILFFKTLEMTHVKLMNIFAPECLYHIVDECVPTQNNLNYCNRIPVARGTSEFDTRYLPSPIKLWNQC